jgi:hypothetical protein
LVYVANAIGALAAVVFVLSYQMKARRWIVLLGAVARILFVVQYLLLGAYAGAVLDVLGIVAAFVAQRKDHPKLKQLLPLVIPMIHLALLGVCIAFYQNIFDVFALLGTSLHVGALWFTKEKHIRRVSLAGSPCWMVYNLTSKAYPSAVSDFFTICSLVIAIIRYDILGVKRMPPTDPDATA